jgi:hypothetical protein
LIAPDVARCPREEALAMHACSLRRFLVGWVIASSALLVTGVAANPVSNLPGRWSGPGNIMMSNGSSEQMRCVATYFVEGNGSSVKQNLRCASQGYKIDAVTSLSVAGNQVSGAWEERTWATTGSIKGNMLGDGFNLTIDGPGFTAAMAVKTTNCNQSISITPRDNTVSRISMTLGKC